MTPTYTITNTTLHIPDPDAFGFVGVRVRNAEFTAVYNEYERNRRSYDIHTLVIRHDPSGRYFATEYATSEMEGFEWAPGEGRGGPVDFSEVWPVEVTVTKYVDVKP